MMPALIYAQISLQAIFEEILMLHVQDNSVCKMGTLKKSFPEIARGFSIIFNLPERMYGKEEGALDRNPGFESQFGH